MLCRRKVYEGSKDISIKKESLPLRCEEMNNKNYIMWQHSSNKIFFSEHSNLFRRKRRERGGGGEEKPGVPPTFSSYTFPFTLTSKFLSKYSNWLFIEFNIGAFSSLFNSIKKSWGKLIFKRCDITYNRRFFMMTSRKKLVCMCR